MRRHAAFVLLSSGLLLAQAATAAEPAAPAKPATVSQKPAKPAAGPQKPAKPAPAPIDWGIDSHDISTVNSEELLKKSRLVARWDDATDAAKTGDATAAMLLGMAYVNGIGIAKDLDEARYCAEEAVKGGNKRAMLTLGSVAGQRGDHAGQLDWYRRAADGGVALAMTQMALLYDAGTPAVPKDPAQEIAWHRRAADAGSTASMAIMGVNYINGTGVPQDDKQGAAWVRKAAELGDAQSNHLMGQLYLTGRGVGGTDLKASLEWLKRGAARGDKASAKLLAELQAGMVADGIH